MTEGTAVYMDALEIKAPPNCIKINAMECFPSNILARAEHAKNWLRTNRVTVPACISPSIILECLWQTMKTLVTV